MFAAKNAAGLALRYASCQPHTTTLFNLKKETMEIETGANRGSLDLNSVAASREYS